MPGKLECHNCGRLVEECSAIKTVEYDLWRDPIPVWVCPECYGIGASAVQPAQPTLGFPGEPDAKDVA